jgi:hypothetical protein
LSYYYFTLTSEATRISDAQSAASYSTGLDLILEQPKYLLWQRELSLGQQYFGFASSCYFIGASYSFFYHTADIKRTD